MGKEKIKNAIYKTIMNRTRLFIGMMEMVNHITDTSLIFVTHISGTPTIHTRNESINLLSSNLDMICMFQSLVGRYQYQENKSKKMDKLITEMEKIIISLS